MGSIHGLGRSLGGGNGNPLRYSCLGNPWTEEPGGLQSQELDRHNLLTKPHQGFPGGSVLKNPPADAGDTDLIPGLGRSHGPWSNKAHAPQLPSLCSRARDPQLPSPWATAPAAHAPQSPCSEMRRYSKKEPRVATREEPPPHTTRGKPAQQQRPSTARNKAKKQTNKTTYHS